MTKCNASYSQKIMVELHQPFILQERSFTHPSLLTRRSDLVLKVGVMYRVQVAKHLKKDWFVVSS